MQINDGPKLAILAAVLETASHGAVNAFPLSGAAEGDREQRKHFRTSSQNHFPPVHQAEIPAVSNLVPVSPNWPTAALLLAIDKLKKAERPQKKDTSSV